jgi:hypothetical protein
VTALVTATGIFGDRWGPNCFLNHVEVRSARASNLPAVARSSFRAARSARALRSYSGTRAGRPHPTRRARATPRARSRYRGLGARGLQMQQLESHGMQQWKLLRLRQSAMRHDSARKRKRWVAASIPVDRRVAYATCLRDERRTQRVSQARSRRPGLLQIQFPMRTTSPSRGTFGSKVRSSYPRAISDALLRKPDRSQMPAVPIGLDGAGSSKRER